MNFDKYIFDFDDTLWARDNSSLAQEVSINNIKLLNEKLGNSAIIISGNTYESIRNKLLQVFDQLECIKFDIWADSNTTLYRCDKKIYFINDLSIDKESYKIINYLKDNYNINAIKFGYPNCVNIKIKPLNNLERKLLVDNLNNYIFKYLNIKNCIAKITGQTTVDILHKNNDKTKVFDYLNLSNYKTVYIGDEVDFGNDKNIASLCSNKICVSDIFDTKGLLQLI